jgi:hypothetical protein
MHLMEFRMLRNDEWSGPVGVFAVSNLSVFLTPKTRFIEKLN